MQKNKVSTHYFKTLTSTQDFAKNELGPLSGKTLYLICSEVQTQGKGTKKRTWISERGGLYMTLAFLSKKNSPTLPCLTTLFACTALEVLEGFGCKGITLKWPNDLRFEKEKMGGVLCEIWEEDPANVRCAIGFGLNLENAPEGIDQQATSIKQAFSLKIPPTDLAEQLAKKFRDNLLILEEKGLNPFLPFLNNRLEGYQKKVTIQNGNREAKGILEGLSSRGGLVIAGKEYFTGDIEF